MGRDFDGYEFQHQAWAIARQRPGASLGRFAVALGLKVVRQRPLIRLEPMLVIPTEDTQKIIDRLIEAQVIQLIPATSVRAERVMPGIEPIRQQQEETDEMTAAYQRIMRAIEEMKARGDEIPRDRLCREAGVNEIYLSSNTNQWNREASKAYDAAIESIRDQRKSRLATPTPPEVEALQRRIKELEAQLKEKSEPQIVQLLPLDYLTQEAAHWRYTIAQLERELEEARSNLGACERLLEVHQGTDQGAANGNGCLAKVMT